MRRFIFILPLLTIVGIASVPVCAYAGNSGSLTGTVVTPQGRGLVGAVVALFKQDDQGAVISLTRSDDRGTYSLHDILPGSYALRVSRYGYQVLTANSGQKALDIISQREAPIDLVITDMVMPAMSGRELVEHLHLISPQTRILCTSGFVRPNQDDDAAYLQKPFTSQDLLLKVKSSLAGK